MTEEELKAEEELKLVDGEVQISNSDLTKLLLQWEELNAELKFVEETIKQQVLLRQKTFVAGDIAATYSGGRASYDYEGAARALEVSEFVIGQFTKTQTTITTDWRAICEQLGLDKDKLPVKSSTAPSVRIHRKA